MAGYKDTPAFSLHREVTAADSSIPTDLRFGIKGDGRRFLNLEVIPTGGANAAIEVLFWSEEASTFISQHTPLTFAGVGADTPYAVSVDLKGRSAWVEVTSIGGGGGEVKVFASLFGAR